MHVLAPAQSLLLLLCTAACSLGFERPPEGAESIPIIGDQRVRFFLLEKEALPTGHLNAIVLQQVTGDGPGVHLAYQINCSRGPAWTTNTEAATVASLRLLPIGDEFLRAREAEDSGQQTARWLCGKAGQLPST